MIQVAGEKVEMFSVDRPQMHESVGFSLGVGTGRNAQFDQNTTPTQMLARNIPARQQHTEGHGRATDFLLSWKIVIDFVHVHVIQS